MAEDKKPQAPPKKAPAPAAPKKPEPKPARKTVLDWVAIGTEIEDILGLDGTATLQDMKKVYPLVKRLVVGPIIKHLKGGK